MSDTNEKNFQPMVASAERRDRRRVLNPADRKIYEPVQLWDRHHEILRRIVLGQGNKQIADDMGISAQTVSNLRNSSLGVAKLSQLRSARDLATVDVAREIREAAPKALKLILDSLDDDSIAMRDRLKQANNLLDRAGHAPVKQIVSQSTNLTLTGDDIEALKARAVAAAIEDGNLIDVKAGE